MDFIILFHWSCTKAVFPPVLIRSELLSAAVHKMVFLSPNNLIFYCSLVLIKKEWFSASKVVLFLSIAYLAADTVKRSSRI